jgi:hypothetical protein
VIFRLGRYPGATPFPNRETPSPETPPQSSKEAREDPVLFHIPADLSSANIPERNFSRSRQLKVIFVMKAAEDCPCGDAIASRKPVDRMNGLPPERTCSALGQRKPVFTERA